MEAFRAQPRRERAVIGVRMVAPHVHQLVRMGGQVVGREEAPWVAGRVVSVYEQPSMARGRRHDTHTNGHADGAVASGTWGIGAPPSLYPAAAAVIAAAAAAGTRAGAGVAVALIAILIARHLVEALVCGCPLAAAFSDDDLNLPGHNARPAARPVAHLSVGESVSA